MSAMTDEELIAMARRTRSVMKHSGDMRPQEIIDALADRLAELANPSVSRDAPGTASTRWRDMSEAPQDGTHILARGVRGEQGPPTTVHWFGPPDLPGLRGGGWYISVQQNEGGRVHPTGWMPLPSDNDPPAHSQAGPADGIVLQTVLARITDALTEAHWTPQAIKALVTDLITALATPPDEVRRLRKALEEAHAFIAPQVKDTALAGDWEASGANVLATISAALSAQGER